MAIKFIKGSLLDSQSQTLVCPVNCVGVMDEGLALSFKLAYPSMYERYKYYCDKSLLRPGMLWLYGSRRRKVLCFPTRLESEGQADSKELENIESGLAKFCATYKDKGITSVAFPLLGFVDGGQLWESTSMDLLEAYLHTVDIPVEIYVHSLTVPCDLRVKTKLLEDMGFDVVSIEKDAIH